jgi:Nitrate/TMAO reductases, membrane-bound tetraheme cytochrome c subunit
MELQTVVKVLGTLACVAGIAAALIVARTRFKLLRPGDSISLGVVTLSSVAFYKLLALGGLVVAPAAAMALANYHTFEGTHEVRACNGCHVMRPMVVDLLEPGSDTLAARHTKNKWIPENQCYGCHSDYGLSGSLAAKMEGYRHLVRYTTGFYREPIIYRGHFDNANCLKCHAGTVAFESRISHRDVRQRLADSNMSCTNCHGWAHPTRAARTPGSPEYSHLMQDLLAAPRPR